MIAALDQRGRPEPTLREVLACNADAVSEFDGAGDYINLVRQ